MRKVLISIAALGLTAFSAAPSMAQSWGNPGGGYGQPGYGNGYDQRGYDQRGYDNDRRQGTSVEQVRFAVERAIRNGRVSGREARALRYAVDDLQRRAYRAQRDGYSWGERRDIDSRAREILQRLQYSNGGYDNGYGRDGRYGDR